jgi:hypothetical protein
VTSLALPLALSGTLARRSEMGCSQSFESDDGSARVSLAVDASGVARLTLEGEHDVTSGPSPGRYMAGDHEISHVRTLHRSVWSGHASVMAGAVLVTFERVEAAEIRIAGYGTLPLPAPTSSAFTGQLRCHVEHVGVLPAAPTAGEVAAPIGLLRCAWASSPPAPFDLYADGAPWALGAGAGVVSRADESWGGGPSHEVRLAP